jgi:hypothetical protein
MAQEWIASAARDAFRDRDDALDRAVEAARIRAWLASLPLDKRTIAALDEPIAALEAGMRHAARQDTGIRPPGGGRRGDPTERG